MNRLSLSRAILSIDFPRARHRIARAYGWTPEQIRELDLEEFHEALQGIAADDQREAQQLRNITGG